MATTALIGGGIAVPSTPVRAQALQPVVDVCSGITLPRSAVTEVIGAVNQPIVDQLETTVNGLTTVTLILAPLASITDLNIDLTTILDDAAAGDPISLQILDTDGNVITASDDCNVGADSFVLDTEGGIEIGGNRISGLGVNGEAASAAESDAIAFGNNATTTAGATGAVALGTDASATAAGSVALGSGSLADRANTVSVGAVGNERQIVNVADGTTDTDAATVGQVNATIAAATDGLVAYDDASLSTVTLGGGASGTVVTNVASGALSASSSDAVNGSQLFATNQNVAGNAAGIATLDGRVATNEGDIAGLDGRLTTSEGDIASLDGRLTTSEGDIASLDGRLTTSEGDIASLDGRVTINEGDITNLDGRVTGSEADIAALDGRVTANDGDIAALDGRVATNEGDIVGLDARIAVNTGDIAALADVAVTYDSVLQESITLAGASGTTVTNVAAGELSATSSDAVNGAQLFATNQAVDALDGRVAQNEADIGANTTAIADLQTTVGDVQVTIDQFDGRIAQNETDIDTLDGRVTVNEGDIASLDGRVTVNEGDIAAIDGRVAVNEGDIANLDGRVTVNEGDIVNLDGRVAVNEGDIANLDGRVAVNEGDIATLDGRVTVNEGDIAAIDGRVTINEGDIANLDGRVTINEGDIANLDGRVAVNEGDIVAIDGRVTVNEGDIAAIDGRVTVNEGDIANLDTRVTVNEGDIVDIDGRVVTNTTNIAELQVQVANVPVGYVADADGTTPSAVPTDTAAFAGASGGTVRVTNVAAANLAADSSDAVNGSQLFATNQVVAQNSADITTITNNLAGSTVVAVQYSDPDNPNVSNGGTITNDVALVGADAAAPVALHNVANGVASTDAVNMGQLRSGLDGAMAASMGYTDQRVGEAIAYTDMRIAEIGFDLADVRDDAFAGTAAAMAMSSIPQTIAAGQSMLSGGVGHFRGETAFGFGYSAAFGDGQGVIKLSGTIDTRGNGGVAAGAGIAF